jgi:hypothetical protein
MKIATRDGRPNLPADLDTTDLAAIWDLILDKETLENLINRTNRNAELNPSLPDENHPYRTKWKPVTLEEMYAYIGVTMMFGLHPEHDIGQYWSTGSVINYPDLRKAIGRRRWEIIDRYFCIAEPRTKKPWPPTTPTKPPSKKRGRKRKRQELEIDIAEDETATLSHDPTIYEKVEWFTDILRAKCKKFWYCGTHLSPDKSIVRFQGRASEKVTILDKADSVSFKIWCLCNHGYILTVGAG